MRNLCLLKSPLVLLVCLLSYLTLFSQANYELAFDFDGNLESGSYQFQGAKANYTTGIDGQALHLKTSSPYQTLQLNRRLPTDGSDDFSIQFWVKTTAQEPMVLLSQKRFENKGILSQKNPGWVLYTSGGTFAWSIGSGDRRLNYERDNGQQMPLNDGQWHQVSLTYDHALSEFRIYYDGQHKAAYKVGFDFANEEPLMIGSIQALIDRDKQYSPTIVAGQEKLQTFVDAFNKIGLAPLKGEEFLELIVDPGQLLNQKLGQESETKNHKTGLDKVLELRKALLDNPYTVFQNRALTELKPVSKIYFLENSKVQLNESVARSFTQEEKLFPANFTLDELHLCNRALTSEEVLDSYNKYREANAFKLSKKLKNLTLGVWNIWHGGIHWTDAKDGWDSRKRIVEMIKEKKIDVVLMQETYSSGDFIAAELGYFYATSSDWDYRYQGSNISVISRYPILEMEVTEATAFNNVAVKLAISKTQTIWAMSNWYGMNQFLAVFEAHQTKFSESDQAPIFFGGDFNAVPHTDNGDSPASKKLLAEGFTDAYRSKYPDVSNYPGLTHRSGVRIDQLYYKGKGLRNTFTEVIADWRSGFPSDHYLIVSKFKLKF